jgi:hypothetical protein
MMINWKGFGTVRFPYSSTYCFGVCLNLWPWRALSCGTWRPLDRDKFTDVWEEHTAIIFKSRKVSKTQKGCLYICYCCCVCYLHGYFACSSAVKMEAVLSFETSVKSYWTTRRHTPVDRALQLWWFCHRRIIQYPQCVTNGADSSVTLLPIHNVTQTGVTLQFESVVNYVRVISSFGFHIHICNLHSICFSTIIFTITRGWHNRPRVAAVPIASQTKYK